MVISGYIDVGHCGEDPKDQQAHQQQVQHAPEEREEQRDARAQVCCLDGVVQQSQRGLLADHPPATLAIVEDQGLLQYFSLDALEYDVGLAMPVALYNIPECTL